MTILTDRAEIDKIREAGKIIKEIFSWLEGEIREGISTAALDREISKKIHAKGAQPAFKGYKGYPASICASRNDVVVHGIPSDEVILKEGDIVGIDVGVKKNGYFADGARTFPVGKVSEEAGRLIKVTRDSLRESVKKAVDGNRLFDISNIIQRAAKKEGYEEVRAFVGHGIGKQLHESPEIPNWGEKGKGILLKRGMVLAVEPMINAGSRRLKVLSDGWTAVTEDGKLSAHFEDTIIVGTKKVEIIT